MPWWQWVVDTLALLLVCLLVYGVLLVVRRRYLTREGGTFELSVRLRHGEPGQGWALGLGRYRGERLEWFRIFTLSPKPRAGWTRSELSYSAKREPEEAEGYALYAGHVIVVCDTAQGPVEMAMSAASLTGLQSWLEAGPPGQKAGKGG